MKQSSPKKEVVVNKNINGVVIPKLSEHELPLDFHKIYVETVLQMHKSERNEQLERIN